MTSNAVTMLPADEADRYQDAYKAYARATCPIDYENDGIQHFVYFARDRDSLKDHALLHHSAFSGAQIMYTWKQLEPSEGVYDFSAIQEDLNYLQKVGKKLFIQLQDGTFNPGFKAVPDYLLSETYDGGVVPQFDNEGNLEGWIAKRWNAGVQERFKRLIQALGASFDGGIEGINLQETSIGVTQESAPSFSPTLYTESIKKRMLALKNAFPNSTCMQYANFMPGEWLPWEDQGYLRSIYQYGEEIGVGLAAPDLMPRRKGQLNHALAMMHEHSFTTPLGIAIQDGNYVGATGADFGTNSNDEKVDREQIKIHKNIVPLLHAFAKDFLKVQYMFWGNETPYFQEDVLACFESKELKEFPLLLSETLQKKDNSFKLPRDLPTSSPSLLIIGFNKASRSAMDAWSNAIEELLQEEPTNLEPFRVMMVEKIPGFIRGTVIRSIRKNTPEKLHRRNLLIRKGSETWEELVQYDETDDAFLILIDNNTRRILWQNKGGPTQQLLDTLRSFLKSNEVE